MSPVKTWKLLAVAFSCGVLLLASLGRRQLPCAPGPLPVDYGVSISVEQEKAANACATAAPHHLQADFGMPAPGRDPSAVRHAPQSLYRLYAVFLI